MDTKIIGNKIANARKKVNMSQAALAQLLFISPQAVGKWERGESVPDIITFSRLAEILNVDLNYFSENFLPATNEMAGEIIAGEEADTAIQEDGAALPDAGQLLTNFSGSNLLNTDFAGVTAHKRKFHGSALRGSDFSGADLTGSTFTGSDVRDAIFTETNLTDCTFTANDLSGARFHKTIMVGTELSKSGLDGATFTNVKLVNAKLTKTDLTKANFENCTFHGVDFNYSDLRGLHLDGQTFVDVKFHNTALNDVTFHGATLKNVSFRSTFAITNKYYKAIATIRFDGAMMDKLTYASLKGIGANLQGVTLI